MNNTQARIDTARALLSARMDGCKRGTYGKDGRCVPAKGKKKKEAFVSFTKGETAGIAAAGAMGLGADFLIGKARRHVINNVVDENRRLQSENDELKRRQSSAEPL